MRYAKDHKEAARRRLLAQGGSHAKQHGFNDSGVAALAAAAGVTTGALYKHFEGKSDLFAALISAELTRTVQMYDSVDAADEASVARSMAGYLSLQHVRHPERGCPLPSLTPEIARADDNVRAAFQAGLLEVHDRLQRMTATSDDAWTLMAQNVGAVMLARALSDEALQQALLTAARRAGEQLLHPRPDAPTAPPV